MPCFVSDEEGVTLTIDRFDPGREKAGLVGKVPCAPLPGDFVIPCSVSTRESAGNVTLHTPEDFASSFKVSCLFLHPSHRENLKLAIFVYYIL